MGDRLSQTVDSQTTNYTLDLNTGLTQVLDDGTNSYTYGLGRILLKHASTTEYFLGDALGSVRQLVDGSGSIAFAQSYDPYGTVRDTSPLIPDTFTSYGYTGEQQDPSGMVYLRARYYNPADGRFTQIDPIRAGNNWYTYTRGNPINYTDPTGLITEKETSDADRIVNELKVYSIFVKVDWGYSYRDSLNVPCGWNDGEWSLNELTELRRGVIDLSRAMGGLNKFIFNVGYVNVLKEKITGKNENAIADTSTHRIRVNTKYNKYFTHWSAVHELGHAWDANYDWKLSDGLVTFTGGATDPNKNRPSSCDIDPLDPKKLKHLPGCNDAIYIYGGKPAAGSNYAFTKLEDFAQSVAAYVYPDEAQAKVEKNYKGDILYETFLYYTDFRKEPRWAYIYSLVQTTKGYQQK